MQILQLNVFTKNSFPPEIPSWKTSHHSKILSILFNTTVSVSYLNTSIPPQNAWKHFGKTANLPKKWWQKINFLLFLNHPVYYFSCRSCDQISLRCMYKHLRELLHRPYTQCITAEPWKPKCTLAQPENIHFDHDQTEVLRVLKTFSLVKVVK